ncbi:hypothetical protein F2Q69_00006556 [Brassica cretica]|uniref:Uncharacterized protein n=1 Tax=Brassica cretica TaxID=69181 RepID=A0A8S9PID0_BRACR|nr:hypothetical protein F2Q69_00006556 [Brassica cretica]
MSFGRSHWCRSTPATEHRSTYTNSNQSTTPTESTASCNAVKILTHEEFAAKHPHPPSPDKVRIDRHANSNVDRHSEANIERQQSPPIDRRAPNTYRMQMPKIDVARLNALRLKPKPSEQPSERVRTPSDDGDDPVEEDMLTTGRTLRRRKEKVAKHLKRGANEKEKENFQKRNDYYNPTIDAYTRQNMHTNEYDEDFEEERAIEYRAILDEEDKLIHHSSWKRNAPSFEMTSLPSINTQPQQRCRKRASTDTAYYNSVDTEFNHVQMETTRLVVGHMNTTTRAL